METGKMMRQLASWLVVVLLLAACSTASTQSTEVDLQKLAPFAFEQRYLTAVLPFEYKDENKEYSDTIASLSDMAMAEMFKSKRFRIVERSRIDAVLGEVSLSQSGVTQQNLADKVGRQLGAEMVLVCSVAAIKAIEARDTVGIAWIESKGFEVTLHGRLVSILHGEVIAMGEASGTEINKLKVAMGATTGEMAPDDTLLKRAMEKAVKILVHDFASQLSAKKS